MRSSIWTNPTAITEDLCRFQMLLLYGILAAKRSTIFSAILSASRRLNLMQAELLSHLRRRSKWSCVSLEEKPELQR